MTFETVAVAADSSNLADRARPANTGKERWLTRGAILATACSVLLLYEHIAAAALHASAITLPLLQGMCVAGLTTALVYGSLIYLFTRCGFLQRTAALVQPSSDELQTVYDREAKCPRICILIPTYKEESRVLRQTVLSAALSEYPSRRIVVLIDDLAKGSGDDLQNLLAARQLVADLHAQFHAASIGFRAELSNFLSRLSEDELLDLNKERHHLAHLCECMADWIEALDAPDSSTSSVFGHTDQFFRERIILASAAEHRARATKLRTSGADLVEVEREYRRLSAFLFVDITSFERKQYANLSHAPNKAMNLNSYIGLIGKSFRVVADAGRPRIEECDSTVAHLIVPNADFLLTLDADSLVLSDYVLKLSRLMDLDATTAVVQTPYSTIPGSRNRLERAAGAQTDTQYVVHQGFTHFGATYWVGANALLRLEALRDVQQTVIERGHSIQVFIQDRTVIEDTGSTIDLVRKGWSLYNHPERLAFSATPGDFGSLIIQRRRWANGGLIIFPDLVRYAVEKHYLRPRLAEVVMRAYYLCSPALTSLALLLLMLLPLDNATVTIWLPCTALPYFALYARDLRSFGYAWADLPRVYALNLMLLPINLAGVTRSVQQMLSGRKAAFGRTPKVEHRTAVPPIHVLWQFALATLLAISAFTSFRRGQTYVSICWGVNAAFVLYGFHAFIGFGNAWRDLRLVSAKIAAARPVQPQADDQRARRDPARRKTISAGHGSSGSNLGRIASMEGLRAYAVVLVFLVHFTAHYFDRYKRINFDSFHFTDATSIGDLIGYYLWASHYGVDLFFLLSGFLIFRIISRPDFRYLTFLRDRLLRLYPAFFFALGLQVAYAALAWNQTFDVRTIAANLLFLHGIFELGIKPILAPTWSLAFEWAFYIVFPAIALLIARGRAPSLAGVGVSAALVMLIAIPVGPHYVRFLMFFVGAALASLPPKAIERWVHRTSDGPVILAMVLINMLFVIEQNFYHFIWPFAVISFLLVGRVIYGGGVLNRIFCLMPIRRLGNMSYSFYLLHGLAVIVVVDNVGPFVRGLPQAVQFVLLMGIAFLVAAASAKASFMLFEKMYFDRKARASSLLCAPEEQPATKTAASV